jgi:hypothetical protein
MKLVLKREQDKGLLGGISFVLTARVDLTSDEQDLVKKYKVHKESLLSKTISILGREISYDLKIGDLIEGQRFKCKDVTEILKTEENVKEACQNLKTYLEVMRSFGGEEVIEY